MLGTGGNIYGPVSKHGLGDKAVRWSKIIGGAKAIATGSSHTVAILKNDSLASAAILATNDIEPILQMTCRDHNRIAMQADLLGASALGIRNILALRGDEPLADQTPPAKAVFDVDPRELMQMADRVETDLLCGEDRAVKTAPILFMGAADTPIDPGRQKACYPRLMPSELCRNPAVFRHRCYSPLCRAAERARADKTTSYFDRAWSSCLSAFGDMDAQQSLGEF